MWRASVESSLNSSPDTFMDAFTTASDHEEALLDNQI